MKKYLHLWNKKIKTMVKTFDDTCECYFYICKLCINHNALPIY